MSENKTALIIEDEEIIALDIENKLRKYGFNTIISHHEKDILKIAQNQQLDLCLVDIMLSQEKDGIQIAEKIIEFQKVPIVFVTAYDDKEIMERVKKSKAYGYIVKPFDEKELSMRITIALNRFETEVRLEEKERWITSILNNITDAILVTDVHGNVTFANAIAEDILSYSTNMQKIVHYKQLFILYDEEDQPFENDIVSSVIRSNMPMLLSEISLKSPDKSILFQGECLTSPLIGHEKKVDGAVLTLRKK